MQRREALLRDNWYNILALESRAISNQQYTRCKIYFPFCLPFPSSLSCPGFESGDGSSEDLVSSEPDSLFPPVQDNPYGDCQLNYWADDYSLYNPVLIVPPPKISSFSEPYFQESTRSLLTENTVSPLRGLHGERHSYPVDSDDVFL